MYPCKILIFKFKKKIERKCTIIIYERLKIYITNMYNYNRYNKCNDFGKN